jgi:peptide/nickel transport system ATP-binding protein
VLNLLIELKEALGLTYVFISHDLNVVRFISDRIMVMYLGEVVESGPSETLFKDARHPYTRALLAAMPSLDPNKRTQEAPITGDPPNPIDPPPGCRFHTRCPEVFAPCSSVVPEARLVNAEREPRPHAVWCHLYDDAPKPD